MKSALICLVALTVTACHDTGKTLSGHVDVIDGDTIVLRHDRRSFPIRLWGIDAEELTEPSGERARNVLRFIIDDAQVTCQTKSRDRYGRHVALCSKVGTPDIAQSLVSHGYALDCARYSGGHYRRYEPSDARNRLRQKPYC